jgi:hypothetical protein
MIARARIHFFIGARLPRPYLAIVMAALYNTSMKRNSTVGIVVLLLVAVAFAFDGFQNAPWGASTDQVKKDNAPTSWTAQPAGTEFPKELNVTIVMASQQIAGRNASVKYYFYNNKFFQATVRFSFDNLKNFDFNYNVYRSVDSYYKAIRDQTLTFVFDIYDLLQKKYGKRQPIFEKLDPRFMFTDLDRYLKKEAWNLRYYPYEYYKKIITSAYARWDHPKTRILFSVNICATEKRFDYLLSLTSLDLENEINKKKDELRMQNL